MRKLIAIVIGMFLVTSGVDAYSAIFNADAGIVRAEMNRIIRVFPELKKLRWRVGRLRGDIAGGFYNPRLNIVTIDDRTNPFAIRATLLHELGHYTFINELDRVQQNSYCRIFEYFGESPSDYGRKNCMENFAETFSSTLYGTRWNNSSRFGIHGTYQGAMEHMITTLQGQFVLNLR